MTYTFVLLSGGIGSRMRNSIPKQYMELAGKPMIMHILETVDRIGEIGKIIIVCEEEYREFIDSMTKQCGISTSIEYAKAGNTRQASVLSGLTKVKTENVIIHEAARPFVTEEDYLRLIREECENAMMGIGIPFTVLKGQEQVEGLLTRSELVNVQLPQKYNTELLLEAHKKAVLEEKAFTEDASLLYYYRPDVRIRIVKGQDYNIKVTTQTDLLIGETLYQGVFGRSRRE
ncbi:MAG: IspD/TarI family cytidylyltransferase [Oscillospiraceae bacterium]|nr:IspD/TarI family cytidylyltransferase [Oscillospiraceae bacterium]